MSLTPFLERLAFPSWVVPGTVAQNAAFLEGKCGEIALCCFQYEACMAYTAQDLPPSLASLNLRWHVHLPLNLNWAKGPEEAAAQSLALRKKVLFLKAYAFVLHPPENNPDPRKALEAFAKIWHSHASEPLFLENTQTYNSRLLSRDFLENTAFRFCLDLAHVLIYRQEHLLTCNLPEYAAMIHWAAPAKGGGHKALSVLSKDELKLYQSISTRLSPQIHHVLEIFNWQGILNSLPILKALLA